ncbi:MAG TPA: hypothetical protein VK540_22805 [Polyangiaceae bacterium]|nr:hypothetical protein [Polyangiaceae bacterium]
MGHKLRGFGAGGTLSLFASMSWGYAYTWYAFTLPYLVAAILLQRLARSGRQVRA